MLHWQTGFLPQIAARLRDELDIRDRSYRLKTYKSCIVASEAVDFMIENEIADSRQDAVALGRLLQEKLGFWHHVCGDHLFKDEFLFFRISRIDKRQIAGALRRGLHVCDRTYRFKTYRRCIVASEAVDFMVDHGLVDSRQEAVIVGRSLQTELGFWHHVCNDHDFKDEYLFFRFDDDEEEEEEPDSSMNFKLQKGSSTTKGRMSRRRSSKRLLSKSRGGGTERTDSFRSLQSEATLALSLSFRCNISEETAPPS